MGGDVGDPIMSSPPEMAMLKFLHELLGEKYVVLEGAAVFHKRMSILQRTPGKLYNCTRVDHSIGGPGAGDSQFFCLAQQFISKLFPMGHVKSTNTDDERFVATFARSRKWLRIREQYH